LLLYDSIDHLDAIFTNAFITIIPQISEASHTNAELAGNLKRLVMAHWRFCRESVQLAIGAGSRVFQKITQRSQFICKLNPSNLTNTYFTAVNH
jgi:hypothetical protein